MSPVAPASARGANLGDLALSDLQLIARIAALKNLSAVARERNVPVSQVSRALTRIERLCAARLVHRSTHGLALTAEGQTLLVHAQQIAGTLEALEGEFAALSGEPSGLVRVASSTVVAQHLLVPSLPALAGKHPRLSIELVVSDLIADLARGGIDIAVRTVAPADTMIARHLGTLDRALYAAPAYAARFGLPRHPDELAQHQLVSNSAATQLNHWPFVVDGVPRTLPIEGRWRANDTAMAANLVLQGLGIGRLSTLAAAPLLREGRLVPVLGGFVDPCPMPVFAVVAGARQRLPKIKACLDHWVDWVAAQGIAATAMST